MATKPWLLHSGTTNTRQVEAQTTGPASLPPGAEGELLFKQNALQARL